MYKIIFIVLSLIFTACENSDLKNQSRLIKFKLDSPIGSLLSASNVTFEKDCNPTICFYDFDIPVQSAYKATITIETSGLPLVFNDAVSALFSTAADKKLTNAKIILGGLPSDSEHTQAIGYFYQQIRKLEIAGWQRYIYPYEARISGSEAKKFKSFDTVLGNPVVTGPWKDPALFLSRTEWLAMPTFNDWYFYKEGVYLTLSVQRENSSGSEQERGSYLFTLSFRSETEFYKSFIDSEDRDHWQTLAPAELKKMAKERAVTEEELKKAGILIDEHYKTPKITVFR